MAGVKDEVSGTGALREEILGDARKRAERTVRNAEREAQEVLSEARRKAEAAEGEISQAARARGEKRARAELASVAVERKRIALSAKEEVIDGIFEAALTRAAAGSGQERRETIRRLAQAAAERISGEELVMRVSASDAELVDEGLLADLNARAGAGCAFRAGRPVTGAGGGVIVEGADGREVFDNTFEARAGRLRQVLRLELARRLWDKTDA